MRRYCQLAAALAQLTHANLAVNAFLLECVSQLTEFRRVEVGPQGYQAFEGAKGQGADGGVGREAEVMRALCALVPSLSSEATELLRRLRRSVDELRARRPNFFGIFRVSLCQTEAGMLHNWALNLVQRYHANALESATQPKPQAI